VARVRDLASATGVRDFPALAVDFPTTAWAGKKFAAPLGRNQDNGLDHSTQPAIAIGQRLHTHHNEIRTVAYRYLSSKCNKV